MPTWGRTTICCLWFARLRSDIPAVTHVDYSARIQTVRHEHHPVFHDLIAEFERQTGCGLLVNTSFNVRGEPIIGTPQDAYRCFMRTEMDVLALEDYILLKPEQPPWFEGKGEGLENEDVVQASAEKAPEKLLEELSEVFDKEFWPAAEKLKASGQAANHGRVPDAPTMWEDANDPADRKPLFELGREALSEDPDPVKFADELTANWLGPEVAAVLKPAVTKLIRNGLKHQVEVEIDEQVSESVYVMF